tara:strand:- start:1513 stop:2208 length:696 start_codon:yes stop_codon:yes gene_type:complete
MTNEKQNEPNEIAKKRGLRVGSRVRIGTTGAIRGNIVRFDSSGDPSLLLPVTYLSCSAVLDPDAEPGLRPDDSGLSVAPPEGDRKPRGEKPPLALIPWSVVPARWRPETVSRVLSLPVNLDPPESGTARTIRILLETEGDDLLLDVARAFGEGARKYGIDNWQTATWDEAAHREYESATLRHLYADAIGETCDPDSGLRHKAHAVASAMIVEWHSRRLSLDVSLDSIGDRS